MSKSDLLTTEQEHHKRAFEQYYALGEKRSYQQVAEQMGVSPSTVKLWARSFGWRRRVQERNAEVARRVADRAIQTGVEEHDRNRKIVQMALMRLAKAIADGKVKMQMGDLDRLIRLQQYLDSVDGGNLAGRPKLELAVELQATVEAMTTADLREAIRFMRAIQAHELRAEEFQPPPAEGQQNCP